MGSRGTNLPLPFPSSLPSRFVSLPCFSSPICRLSLRTVCGSRAYIRRDTRRIHPPPLSLAASSVFTKAASLILILLHIALQIAGKRAWRPRRRWSCDTLPAAAPTLRVQFILIFRHAALASLIHWNRVNTTVSPKSVNPILLFGKCHLFVSIYASITFISSL